MMWNHDISAAPRGRTIQVQRLVKDKNSTSGEALRTIEETRREYILAVQPDGTVVMTCWIPAKYSQSGKLLEGNRWSGFNVGQDPIAWAPWPVYEPKSDVGEVAAVKAKSRLANAESVEPSASGLITHKHIFLDDCGSGA